MKSMTFIIVLYSNFCDQLIYNLSLYYLLLSSVNTMCVPDVDFIVVLNVVAKVTLCCLIKKEINKMCTCVCLLIIRKLSLITIVICMS